jgi:hypothetical protein
MVIRKSEGGLTLYVCEVCGFLNKKKSSARKCQDYYTKNKECSLEITSHSEK